MCYRDNSKLNFLFIFGQSKNSRITKNEQETPYFQKEDPYYCLCSVFLLCTLMVVNWLYVHAGLGKHITYRIQCNSHSWSQQLMSPGCHIQDFGDRSDKTNQESGLGLTWQGTPEIAELRKLKQETHEFKARPGYIAWWSQPQPLPINKQTNKNSSSKELNWEAQRSLFTAVFLDPAKYLDLDRKILRWPKFNSKSGGWRREVMRDIKQTHWKTLLSDSWMYIETLTQFLHMELS